MKNHNKMKVASILSILFFGFIFLKCQSQPKTLEEVMGIYKQGIDYYEKGKYDKAVKKFVKVISLTSPQGCLPDRTLHYDASFYAIACYTKSSNYKKAISICEEWFKVYPEAKPYRILAFLYDKVGKKEQAKELCEKGLTKGFQINGQLALILSGLGKHELAIHHYKIAIKNDEEPAVRDVKYDNKLAEEFLNLSKEFFKNNNNAMALKALEDGIMVSQDFRDRFMEQIRTINQLSGDPIVNQEKTLKRLIARAPKEGYFRSALIDLYMNEGYYKDAEIEIDNALRSIKNYEQIAENYYKKIIDLNCNVSTIAFQTQPGEIMIKNNSSILDWDKVTVHVYNDKSNKSGNDFFHTEQFLPSGESKTFHLVDFKNMKEIPYRVGSEYYKFKVEIQIKYKGYEAQFCVETTSFWGRLSLEKVSCKVLL